VVREGGNISGEADSLKQKKKKGRIEVTREGKKRNRQPKKRTQGKKEALKEPLQTTNTKRPKKNKKH